MSRKLHKRGDGVTLDTCVSLNVCLCPFSETQDTFSFNELLVIAELWVWGRGGVSVFTANLHIKRAAEWDAILMKLWDRELGVCLHITANLLWLLPDIITALWGTNGKKKNRSDTVFWVSVWDDVRRLVYWCWRTVKVVRCKREFMNPAFYADKHLKQKGDALISEQSDLYRQHFGE